MAVVDNGRECAMPKAIALDFLESAQTNLFWILACLLLLVAAV